MLQAEELIEKLNLTPHPEGGFYRELFRSENLVETDDERGKRAALTTIYFLLPKGITSALHLVRSAEVWHFLEGAPLEVITCDGGFSSSAVNRLGLLSEGEEAEYVVPANVWQAARSTGEWTLVSCVVAPGFEFEDFRMLRDSNEECEKLKRSLPELVPFI